MTQLVQQLFNGLVMGSIYGLMALGLTMTYGLMGIVNFAHGGFAMAGAFAMFTLNTRYGMPFLPASLLSMVMVGGLGFVVERCTFRYARHEPINGLMISIGLIYIMENACRLVFGTETKAVRPLFGGTADLGGVVLAHQRLLVVALSVVLMGVFYIYVRRSKAGKAMRAVAENPFAAVLMGVSLDRVTGSAFAIGCALAAAAGIALGSLFVVTAHMGSAPLMKAFVVITLGGFGSIRGAFVAAFIIGVVDSLAAGYVSSAWADIFSYLLFILILVLKPKGIFGEGS